MLKPKIENYTHKTLKPCFLIRGFLSEPECSELVKIDTTSGFTPANDKYPKSYRTNQRYWEDDFNLAKHFSDRLVSIGEKEEALSSIPEGYHGLNERFRYCKYSEGETFSNHLDGHYFRGNNIESKMTFLLYLNDGYAGGETNFYSDKDKSELLFSYQGKVGDVLIFDHDIWHEGSAVLSGTKYILRSDLLFDSKTHSENHLGYVWSLTATDEILISTGRDKSIRSWDNKMNALHEANYHEASVLKVVSNDDYLYSTGRDGFICKATLNLDLIVKQFSTHATGLDLTLLNRDVASVGSDGYLRLWDDNLNSLHETKAHNGWAWCVSHFRGDLLVSAGDDGFYRIWDSTLTLLDEFDLCAGAIRCMTIFDEHIFIGTEIGTVLKANLSNGGIEESMQAHSGIVRDLKVVDGKLYSAGEDFKVNKISLDFCNVETIYEGLNFMTCVEELSGNVLVSGYEGKIINLTK